MSKGLGIRVYSVHGLGIRVRDSDYRVQCLWYRVLGLVFGSRGLGFRV